MIKRPSNIAIFVFLWFSVNILFLDPLQCFVFFSIIGLLTWVVVRLRFQTIMRQHGSFQSYIDSLDKSDKYVRMVKELTKKFSWLGPSSVQIFFYSVGENITRLASYIQRYLYEGH